ncbi:EutN/CcmL family microcompartment protein [Hathewaya histolytica]|uniref:Ethanolamine/propanediol utilization protein n=1 Tax=Hathewaya histolytica TaxID=1498 RepID=A0A4U9R102_HATHI|nr:EutN/CcmL family microcompartment protein [Hathewaya histolytica]VTQ84755.1 ethanolamine/propanediol utilization protein [Hathewaya histolytica]
MIIGEVIGNVWATRKDEKLNGLKLLVVNPINFGSTKKSASTMVAADSVGAGIGDKVLIVKGSSARMSNSGERVPVDATIVGIIDSLEINE